MGNDEPVGYKSPAKALINLEKLRRQHGAKIKLYKAEAITGKIVKQKHLEQANSKKGKTELEYSLIEEYLK